MSGQSVSVNPGASERPGHWLSAWSRFGSWIRRPAGAVLGVLGVVVWGLTRLFSYRGLCLCFLALMAWLASGGWLRPPLSDDIRTFHLPLRGAGQHTPSPAAMLYGPRELVAASPGFVLWAAVAVGVLVALRRPNRFALAAGLLVCVVLGCVATVALNHPELTALLDDQLDQRRQLVTVLAGTIEPPLRITDSPRVQEPADGGFERGSLLRGGVYLNTHRLLPLLLAAVACLLATGGGLGRRIGHLALWSAAGAVLAVALTSPRLFAEWRWQRAAQAEARGDWEAAERHAAAALELFPELRQIERTWVLLGRLDYRQSRASPAASYFHAQQLARNEEWRCAIAELSELVRHDQPTPAARRWLASLISERAASDFHSGRFHSAEEGWQAAAEADPSPGFRLLMVATVRARSHRDDPGAIADMVDPLLPQLRTDRTLRAALLAMLGDTYFDGGRFAEARARYEASTKVYNLPKQVNFRAQRGLLGM
jgi:hypothetical protein